MTRQKRSLMHQKEGQGNCLLGISKGLGPLIIKPERLVPFIGSLGLVKLGEGGIYLGPKNFIPGP